MVDDSSSPRKTKPAEYRGDDEPPAATARLGWRYHHIGIPTEVPHPGEKYIPQYKMYVSGFSSSPYGIEWMRFEAGCPLHEIIRSVPHIAFEVDDLDAALEGQEVISPPGSPSDGVRAAMIVHNGAPVELIAFRRNNPEMERSESKGVIMSSQTTSLSLGDAYQDFAKLILSLPDEQFLAPMNGWTPRDVVAHLIGWNGLMIEASQSILAGRPPSYYADTKNDYSHINAGFTKKYASPSKQELLAELKSSMEKFEAFISTLPKKELTAEHGVVHYSGLPATVGKIMNSLAGDYQYHTRQISEWLIKKGNLPQG